MKLRCPHGHVTRSHFQWLHKKSDVCSIMLERSYEKVATQWQPNKKFDLKDPEVAAYIATKRGIVEFAEYLSGRTSKDGITYVQHVPVDESIRRMAALMQSRSLYSVVANTLYGMEGFSQNAWWMGHRIPGYQTPDVWYGRWCAGRVFRDKHIAMVLFADWERAASVGDVSALVETRIAEARRSAVLGVDLG